MINDLSSISAPNFMWLTPNLLDDAHDCGIGTADAYLNAIVTQILQSYVFTHTAAALIVTFDEANLNDPASTPLYFAVSGPVARTTYASSALYTHYGTLHLFEQNWNLPCIVPGADCSAPAMSEFFSSVSSNFSPSTLYQRYYTVCNPACYITPLTRLNSTLMTLSSINGFGGTVTATISPYNSNPIYGPVTNFAGSGTNTETFTIPSGGSVSDNIQVFSCRATPSGNWAFTVTVTGGYGVINGATSQFTVVVTGTGRNQSCPI